MSTPHTFLDLFSGAGGMSFGFYAHPAFRVVGAYDGQRSKPSSSASSGCNESYQLNLGLRPTALDLAALTDADIAQICSALDAPLDVLSACPPCTGFSRANPNNHRTDDHRNSLVWRTEAWVRLLRPKVLVMENARELLRGNFSHHFAELRGALAAMGYDVHAAIHSLDRFGLPQRRERALVVATTLAAGAKGLEQLWEGLEVQPEALTVRRAIAHLPPLRHGERHPDDRMHVCPGLNPHTLARLRATPHDGGSWIDLVQRAPERMTPAMRRTVAAGRLGSHPDVYGRMAWDRPAMTIKRECSHVGNGRYAHPEQDRLCSVREMALLQGFPSSYQFGGALSNMYRHIGDAVPPLISFQLAQLVAWMFGAERPSPAAMVLPGTSLRPDDLAHPPRTLS